MPLFRLLPLLLFLFCFHSSAYAKYEGFLPPGPTPIPVGVAFYINNIDNVNELTSSVALIVTMVVHWQNPHLKFVPIDGKTSKTYTGAAAIDILKNYWRPYLDIANREDVYTTHQILLKVSADGAVELIRKIELNLDLNSNIRRFPFDKQKVSINLVPYAYTSEDVQLYKMPQFEGIAPHIVIPNWGINPQFSTEVIKVPSLNLNGMHSVYNFTFMLERISDTYTMQVLVPLFIIAFMCYLMMLTPIDIGSNFQVLITIVLAMIAFQWLVLNTVPSTSYLNFTEIIILIAFLFCCLVMISMSFLEIIRKYYGEEERHSVLKIIAVLLPVIYLLANAIAVVVFFFF